MKKSLIMFLIISALSSNANAQTHQAFTNELKNDFKIKSHHVNQLKAFSKQMLLDSPSQKSSKFSTGVIMQITGGVLIAGFLVSIIVFKQDIFTALPLSLLGSGIALIFMGSSLE